MKQYVNPRRSNDTTVPLVNGLLSGPWPYLRRYFSVDSQYDPLSARIGHGHFAIRFLHVPLSLAKSDHDEGAAPNQ